MPLIRIPQMAKKLIGTPRIQRLDLDVRKLGKNVIN
jgi:hypothetical protein